MKIYQSSTDYAGYSFPTVSLAYFIRYPNPFAKHVLSTDTISQHIDPITKRLHTTRLHLKKSKVPAGILKFLPKSMAGKDGQSQTYILETSVIDVKEGWMETESRNMEFTGVLSVIEKQTFQDKTLMGGDGTMSRTTVTLISRLGERLKKRRKASESERDEDEAPKGWLASLSTAGIQRTIELIGMKRTQTALINSSEGMKVVLERLRSGGLKKVFEGMRHDTMDVMAMHQPVDQTTWKAVWNKGIRDAEDDEN